MLVDEIHINIKAGHGGAGKVAFNTVPKSLGPTGGNGGQGGSVYAEGVSDLSALSQYRYKKDFFAEDGAAGGVSNRTGRTGDDLVLKVPIGTVIYDKTTKKKYEVTKVGEKVMIAKGGLGGRGNFMFRSSRNPSPEHAQPGLPGEKFEATFELQLIADIGLIGLPNAGKSSLLNELTKAGARVANYPFTTLEPNLGVFYPAAARKGSDEEQKKVKPIILADIPGLIEGASSGKGLGFKFLRHIERTKVLFHCVAADSENVSADYKTVRDELKVYSKTLGKKESIIVLTKSDVPDAAALKKQVSALKRFKKPMIIVSIHNSDQLSQLKHELEKLVQGV